MCVVECSITFFELDQHILDRKNLPINLQISYMQIPPEKGNMYMYVCCRVFYYYFWTRPTHPRHKKPFQKIKL